MITQTIKLLSKTFMRTNMRINKIRKIPPFLILMLLTVGGIFLLANSAGATISSGTIAGNAERDLVVATTSADYNVVFETDVPTTTKVITVTLPSNYTITDGNLGDVDSAINNNEGSGSVVTGMVSVNGVNSAVNNVVGNAAAGTIAVTLDSAENFSVGSTTFRFLIGI